MQVQCSALHCSGQQHRRCLGSRACCHTEKAMLVLGFSACGLSSLQANLSQQSRHIHSRLHTRLHGCQLIMTGFPTKGRQGPADLPSSLLSGILTAQGD